MSNLSLFTLTLLLCSLNQAASEVYYIYTVKSDDLCTMQPCLTLSKFAANSSHYLHSNTTLVFLPGTHYLSKDNLILSNVYVDNFIMKSENSKALIKCKSDSRMHFSCSQHIHITNLEFIGCGGNRVQDVEEFVVQDTMFKGEGGSRTALKLIGTAAQIVNSTFVSNTMGSYRECAVLHNGYCIKGFVGGAIIATNSTTVTISQSNFEDNGAEFGGAIFADNRSTINLTDNVSFINNSAYLYGGVLLIIMEAEKGNFVRFRNPQPASRKVNFYIILCECPAITYGG